MNVLLVKKYLEVWYKNNLKIARDQFYLYECCECKMKTAYCISCDKILGKLFNNKFAKCDVCQKITKSYSKELVEAESKSSFFNEHKKNIDEDIQKVFGDSIIQNELCYKSLFGGNDNSKSLK